MDIATATMGEAPAPLSAYGDRTVSMIRAKYETRSTLRFMDATEHLLCDEIREVTGRRFKAGKWLAREDARSMERLFREIHQGASLMLDERQEERLPTRARPRSWGVSMSRTYVRRAVDGCFRLAANVLDVSRKNASYQSRSSIHSWTSHAQERMHERTPTSVRADREIGSSIL